MRIHIIMNCIVCVCTSANIHVHTCQACIEARTNKVMPGLGNKEWGLKGFMGPQPSPLILCWKNLNSYPTVILYLKAGRPLLFLLPSVWIESQA